MKKMMQEARKARIMQSLHQCPKCGTPGSFYIELKVDKWTGKKSAYAKCSACGFEATLEDIPAFADEFWVYSKLSDMVYMEESKLGAKSIEENVVAGAESVEQQEGALEEGGGGENVEIIEEEEEELQEEE